MFPSELTTILHLTPEALPYSMQENVTSATYEIVESIKSLSFHVRTSSALNPMSDLVLVVLLVVGVVSVLTGLVLGLLLVDEVKTTGLDLAVDEGTGESGEELLGLSVVLGLTYLDVSGHVLW